MQAVDRTLDVIEAVANAEENLRLSQLHEQLNLPLGTVHRLLSALIERGYVAQDADTQRYGPGPQLLVTAAAATANSRFRLQPIAHPSLQQLMAETGETANLVLLHGDEIVYVDQVVSARLVSMFTAAGRRAPLYCTGAGKAILSTFDEGRLETYLRRVALEPITAQTMTSVQALSDELARTRERGFAVDDEEREEGVRCVAAPVYNHLGNCIAAISVSGPTMRVSRMRVYELGPVVRAAALECSTALGYTIPDTREQAV